ncbi:MAG: glycoside hydrolase family 3 N-terminal domain-containing protein, partial [bacterium]|nr:glycoside hydrolase family 3 N-terminal domain-containing protein [bacterium]
TDFELFDHEVNMLDRVTDAFDKVVVLLNVGGTINLQYFQQDKIQGLVYSLQAGMEGGLATADLLCGDVNFSGKLVDTLAKNLCDYPSTETFSESKDYVRYIDDVYVGYRYFETIPGADEKVLYPFGFGLSYTTFDISNISAEQNGDEIKICAEVTNTGNVAGKEVVQVYFSTPSEKILTPRLQLSAFKKTNLLNPQESEVVCVSFKINDMASYDDLGYLCKSAYVLQQGDYNFFVGNSIRQLDKVDFTYTVKEEFRVVQQLSQRCVPYGLDKRLLADGTYEQLPTGDVKPQSYPEIEGIHADAPKDPRHLCDVANNKITLDEFIAQLSTDDLISLVGGQHNTGVADTGGMGNLETFGIPNVMTADGPAGLRIEPNRGNINTTAWPIATLLASTWNTQLVFEIGEATAKEVKENNIGIWLSPAINIHRTPLCGRNFEYFSEDPLVSGKMAAAQINGIQSQNIACSIKHFACNNKEVNRKNSDSRVSERALREIYLKGFEIAIKESDPWTLMSAYNLINGIRASENHDLLTKILRDEWGYKGMVTSDWTNDAKHVKEVKAGNDIKMPIGAPDELKSAIEDNTLSRAELEVCVKRILNMILKLD